MEQQNTMDLIWQAPKLVSSCSAYILDSFGASLIQISAKISECELNASQVRWKHKIVAGADIAILEKLFLAVAKIQLQEEEEAS